MAEVTIFATLSAIVSLLFVEFYIFLFAIPAVATFVVIVIPAEGSEYFFGVLS